MNLSPMRYKNYTWPHNPKVYNIEYERKMVEQKVPYGGYLLQDLGSTRRVMRGEGEFVGADAYRQFGLLANVFYSRGSGVLVHPVWQAARAYFVSLKLEQVPRENYVKYSFVFWEEENGYVPDELVNGQGGGQIGSDGNYTVKSGDNLWEIANRYGLTVSQLLAMNPQIKNPSLIRPGDEVRLQ